MEHQSKGMSYWETPFHDKLDQNVTIPKLVKRRALEHNSKDAYIVRPKQGPRQHITFKNLLRDVQLLATAFQEDLGLKKGDFVMIAGDTCLEWILCDLACAISGIITIRCRVSLLTKDVLMRIVQDNNVQVLFFHPGTKGEFSEFLQNCLPTKFRSCADQYLLPPRFLIQMAGTTKTSSVLTFADLMNSARGKLIWEDFDSVKPNDLLTVFMTSGSTGFPKAIPVSHFKFINMFSKTRFFSQCVKDTDRIFNECPLCWIGSMMHMPLFFGVTMVYVRSLTTHTNDDIQHCINVMKEERCNAGALFQYLLYSLVPHKDEMPKFDWIISGAEVIQPSLIHASMYFTKSVTIGYGSSETGFLTSSKISDPLDEILKHTGVLEYGVQTMLAIWSHWEKKIVIRSPFAFSGYLTKESSGMEIDKDGWIHTDDAGILCPAGYLDVLGRRKHAISRGIILTYPTAVERIINGCPGVDKVLVVSVPDSRLGENICACVIPKQDIRISEKYILDYFKLQCKTDDGQGMVPGYVVFMEKFSMIGSKIDRNLVQQAAIKILGL